MQSTNWYILNIKARKNQKPEHYVEALNKLEDQDPLVNTWRDRFVSISSIEESAESSNDIPSWMIVKFISYIIIDKKAFYSKRKKQHVDLEWDDDIVANFRESECVFFPGCHKLAVRYSSKIPYQQIVKYLDEALGRIEPDMFDVTVCTSDGFLNSIRQANAIVKLDAEISFSNPTNTKAVETFLATFDDKIRKANPEVMKISLTATKQSPLGHEKDGLVDSIISITETDGSLVATIQAEPDGAYQKVCSAKHPKIITYHPLKGEFWGGLYNMITSLFSND